MDGRTNILAGNRPLAQPEPHVRACPNPQNAAAKIHLGTPKTQRNHRFTQKVTIRSRPSERHKIRDRLGLTWTVILCHPFGVEGSSPRK
jgi:hypothetical protein